jgi:hypothetical protein
VEPGGDARWDEPPLDVQIPDDARELERDILAYRRELRAARRKRLLRRVMPTQAGIMPLIASILAVCLVAGMMLSVFTIGPTESPAKIHAPSVKASTQPATPHPSSRPAPSRSTVPAGASRTPSTR